MEKRLQTVLARAGVASRRHSAEIIESGRVKVDGRTVRERGMRLDPDKHTVEVDGKLLCPEEKKYYFLLNKPPDIICTAKDTHGRKKITDIFAHVPARLYPVGRLDKDTTGLIIVTNDGPLAHALSHPSFEIEKEYVVKVAGHVKGTDIRRLREGISLGNDTTSPCNVSTVKRDDRTHTLRVKIHEGKKRQVRRMMEAVGREVLSLKRVKYAGLTVSGLREGTFRELTQKEISLLRRKISAGKGATA